MTNKIPSPSDHLKASCSSMLANERTLDSSCFGVQDSDLIYIIHIIAGFAIFEDESP